MNLMGPGEGHGASEAQPKAQARERSRLIKTAVKGMCNPSSNAKSTKTAKHQILRTTDMKDDG